MVQQAISTVLETAKPEIDTQNRNNKNRESQILGRNIDMDRTYVDSPG
jgi:hypothetical protein